MNRITISNVPANAFSQEHLVALYDQLKRASNGAVELHLLPNVVRGVNEDGEIVTLTMPLTTVYWHIVTQTQAQLVAQVLHRFFEVHNMESDVTIFEQSGFDYLRMYHFVNGRLQHNVMSR